MKKYSGLTLVELLATLAIAGVLVALALPSFRGLMDRRAVEAATADLLADFSYARAEALKRGHSVTICRSGSGTACEASDGSWHVGWIVFDDLDEDEVVDTSETVLRVHPAVAGIRSIQKADGSDAQSTFPYRASGLTPNRSGSLKVLADATRPEGWRVLCMSFQGRLSPRPGASAC